MSPSYYPPRRSRSRGWPVRDRSAQAAFRAAVIQLAGGRCQYVARGVRCPAMVGLVAHHTEPGNDDPASGLLLCRPHHRLLDPRAR